MAVLDQLTLSNAAPKRDTSPVGRFRRRIIEAIELQMAIAEADASGTQLKRTRSRWVKNDAGEKELREVPLRLRKWWWTDDAGVTRLSPRHGGRVLEVAPGKTAIEIGGADELKPKLAILREAVRAGELDRCMAASPFQKPKGATKEGEKGVPSSVPRKGSRKAEERPSPGSP